MNLNDGNCASTQNDAINVMIFGSCVSRDVLNYDVDKAIKLVGYYARSSFASAFSPMPSVDLYSVNLQSAFQSAIVKADFEKSLQCKIGELDFDVFLIDLIDERFSVFSAESGGLVTVSNELRSAGFDQQSESGRLIKSGSEEFFTLWESGWERFVSAIKEAGGLKKVVVNRTFWSEGTSDGKDFIPAFKPAYIDESNSFLMRLYQRMACDLSPDQFISPPSNVICGNAEHKWGVSPFHYVDDFYFFVLNDLLSLRLKQGAQLETHNP